MCPKADHSLSTTPSAPSASSQPLPNTDHRGPLRAKTLGTRLTPAELAEVEAAAKAHDKSPSEWLRDVALRAARPSPDVNELLLSEVVAIRYMILNLFDASAKAAQRNEGLPPEDVLRIRDAGDSRKRATAQKLLQEFMGLPAPVPCQKPTRTGGAQ